METNKDVYKEVNNLRNTDNIDYGPVYLVDNLRATFIYSVISDLKSKYQDDYYFIYQTTGNNINSLNRKSYGKVLPVEMITSPIQIFKTGIGKEEKLNIYTINEYNDDEFIRLISLSRDLTEQWASQIIISFSKYDRFESENSVNKTKSKFSDTDLVNKISVNSYELKSFRKLEENK